MMEEAGRTGNVAGLNNLQHCQQGDAIKHKLEGKATSPYSSCSLPDYQSAIPFSTVQSSSEARRKDVIHQ